MFTSALKSLTSNISANYTVSTTPTARAGAWKLYDGKNKKTGKAVSVFVFERKSLEASGGLGGRSGSSSLKRIHDEVVERLKKEANALARLRHPSILQLAEPVEDTRTGGLIFATEPVVSSLAGLLQDQDNQERGDGARSRSGRYRSGEYEEQTEQGINQLEIQKGMLQVAQGLEFLHESAGLVHGNLSPEAIYVSAKSDWKIAGLGFSGPPDAADAKSAIPPISLSEVLYHDPRLPTIVQLDMDYTSPDFVLDSIVSASADMFSLGLLMLALYNSPHVSPLNINSNTSTYKKLFSSSSSMPSSSNNFLCARPLPKELLTGVFPRLITRKAAGRMNVREFQQSQFFNNVLVSTIKFLESMPAKTSNEKAQFLRGLPRILDQFPNSVLAKTIVPAILGELNDRDLMAPALRCLLKIMDILPYNKRVFQNLAISRLREVFLGKGGKATIDHAFIESGLIVILENVGAVAELCSGKDFQDVILPVIKLGLNSPTHAIVDKALGCVSTTLNVVDFSTIKNDFFPAVAAVFSKTSSLGIKVRCMEAFLILCGGSPKGDIEPQDDFNGIAHSTSKLSANSTSILDKYTVQERIVPLLKGIKTKEPGAIMAALDVFRQVGKIADADFLAMDVLPALWTFSLGPLLNLQQFQGFMSLIKLLSAKIEQEQTKKLRELSSNTNSSDNSNSNDLMSVGSGNAATSSGNGGDLGADDFERLVLGKKSAPEPDIFGTGSNLRPPYSSPWSTNIPSSNGIAPTHASAMSTVRPGFSSRAITPDHTLSNFTPLQPTSYTGSPTTLSNFPPMQPSQFTSSTSSWLQQPKQPSTLPILPQPLTTSKSFQNQGQLLGQSRNLTTFSVPAPPVQDVAANGNYGGGQAQGKKGLDAYESLL